MTIILANICLVLLAVGMLHLSSHMLQVLKYSSLTLSLKVDPTHPHLHFPAKATEIQRDGVLDSHTAKKAGTRALPLAAALRFPSHCMPMEQ